MRLFLPFLRLGLTSFGGPIAHLGYFRNEFVQRKGWLDDKEYSEMVALCQTLPGPTSSQVAMAIGLKEGGVPGAFVAWLAFTLPSAMLMFLLAHTAPLLGSSSWIHGLKIVAVVIVAEALRGMGKTLCPDPTRASIAAAVLCFLLLFPSVYAQALAIALSALLGYVFLKDKETAADHQGASHKLPVRAWVAVILFCAVFASLPWLLQGPMGARIFAIFFRAGSLVFGGGHVVLPLLQAPLVPEFMSNDSFLAGYAAAQALPGPLFSIATYLGAVAGAGSASIALFALFGIFLPGILLYVAVRPFWESLMEKPAFSGAIRGVNAGVVGLLLAAFYDPIWISAIDGPKDFAAAAVGWICLALWRAPSWAIVIWGLIYGLW